MRDAGVRLRELPARTDITMWKAIVRQYARLQRNVAPHVDTLLALGVRDLRLDGLATRFAELLSDEELLLVGRKGGLTRAEHRRLLEWQPELRDLCAELSAYDIPETIEHNDLHSANVFLDGERPYFVDWGDASISHPFHTLRTTLAIVANTLETGTDDPSLLDVRDAYLSEFGDPVALKEPFELAQRTAAVTNVLTWAPFVEAMLPAFRKRYGRSIAEDARMILDVI
jgi:Phosphotransferase enzyme family